MILFLEESDWLNKLFNSSLLLSWANSFVVCVRYLKLLSMCVNPQSTERSGRKMPEAFKTLPKTKKRFLEGIVMSRDM